MERPSLPDPAWVRTLDDVRTGLLLLAVIAALAAAFAHNAHYGHRLFAAVRDVRDVDTAATVLPSPAPIWKSVV